MRRVAFVALLISLGLSAIPGYATPLTVDFGLVVNPADITIQHYVDGWTGYRLDGVSFAYESQALLDDNGEPILGQFPLLDTDGNAEGEEIYAPSTLGTAEINSGGLFGDTSGIIHLAFDTLQSYLSFDFLLLGNELTETAEPDDLALVFMNGSDLTDIVTYGATLSDQEGVSRVKVVYNGTYFDTVNIVPTPEALWFSMPNLTTVPEPGTFVFLGSGLIGLVFFRRLRPRH